MQMNTIVVIDEDQAGGTAVAGLLRTEGFRVVQAGKAEEGLEQICRRRPCLIVISLPLKGQRGAELCRRIRTLGIGTPLVVLSPSVDPLEEIVLLESGADDYLAKPVRASELVARVRAVVRQSGAGVAGKVAFGEIDVDVERRYIRRRGQQLKVTRNGYNLLLFFIRNADQALTRDVILNEVWGYDCFPNTRTVDVHILKLRNKLEPDPRVPRHFLTIHGVGYRFVLFPGEMQCEPEVEQEMVWG